MEIWTRYVLLCICLSGVIASDACREQRELSAAADAAARAYKDETPFEHRITVGIWKAMTTAEDKARKSIRSKSFEKYVAVANLKNGNEFFDEVRHLYLS